jgi:hypothetical protein
MAIAISETIIGRIAIGLGRDDAMIPGARLRSLTT